MSKVLTQAERKTLNDAMRIILENTPRGASWMIGAHNYTGDRNHDATYFDSAAVQHTSLGGYSPGTPFADRIQLGLDKEASISSPESVKQARIKYLRAELSRLEGDAA